MTLRTLDHFDVLERIGTGGMGAVFKARDRHLHRTVAVKLLLPEVNADAERRSRFLREGRAAGALNHPNIATIFEVGEVRMGREDLVSLGLGAANAPLVLPYIAMEYVEGRDLGELMEDRALDTRQALEVARQILAALGAAHAAGVVHRDLKPANILVGADGTTKLLDFGLAKILRSQPADLDDRTASQLTLDGTVMGTLPYLAPEQLQSSRVDGRADVFALGVILYEMLAGTTPYPGSTMVEYARAVLIEDIEPLSSHDPSLPPWIGDLTLRLLTTEPNLRPDVPQALAELERNLGVVGPRLGDGIDPGRGVEKGPQAFVSSSSFETVPAVDGGRRFALMALGVAALLSTALVLWVALAGRGDHGTFDTGDPELAFVRGRELLAAGRLDEAQQLLSQATAQAGDRPRYWYYLGEVYRIQGLTDFARAAYDPTVIQPGVRVPLVDDAVARTR
ncbi:MAG: protein kinase [Acidobacteriota bacterium]